MFGCVQLGPPAPRSLACPRCESRPARCSYTYGSERAACRRNISPVKSLARPPRRTARLACASRRAPTETRALLAQSNVQYPTRVSRSLVASIRPASLPAPATVDPPYPTRGILSAPITRRCPVVCVRSACAQLALICVSVSFQEVVKTAVIIRLPTATVSIASAA